MLQLVLEDDTGKVIPQNGIGGNELSRAPVTLQLPVASTLRVTITTAAIPMSHRDRVASPVDIV